MPKQIKGAFWPESRKVASPELQKKLGCDPTVASIFHGYFLTDVIPAKSTIIILEASRDQWLEIAGEWEIEMQNSDDSPSKGKTVH